jgi:hypothetical protein
MTPDDENTARELLASAFADIARDAPKINGVADLAKMVVKHLKDETDFYDALQQQDDAALFAITIHEHGTAAHDNKMNLGTMEIEILAKVKQENSPLLANLANPRQYFAYGLAFVSERDDERALLLVIGTADQRHLFALAIDGHDDASAWLARPHDEMPETLRKTVTALAKAAAR